MGLLKNWGGRVWGNFAACANRPETPMPEKEAHPTIPACAGLSESQARPSNPTIIAYRSST